MSKKFRAIAIVGALLAVMLALFSARVVLQLPGLEPGSKVTVEMYRSLLNAFKVVSIWVLPVVALWLFFTSAVLWSVVRKAKLSESSDVGR